MTSNCVMLFSTQWASYAHMEYLCCGRSRCLTKQELWGNQNHIKWRYIRYDNMIWPHITDKQENKVHGANMGPTWALSAPDGPHGGPMNLAIRERTDQDLSNKPRRVQQYFRHSIYLSFSGQNGSHFADDIFKRIFLNGKIRFLTKISLMFVPNDPIDNNSALV